MVTLVSTYVTVAGGPLYPFRLCHHAPSQTGNTGLDSGPFSLRFRVSDGVVVGDSAIGS